MAKPPLSGVAETEYTKSQKEESIPLLNSFLSPRGDRCEQSATTVPLQHSHGYRFETLKRRLGFAAVPCQATANLAARIWVLAWGSLCADGMKATFFILAVGGLGLYFVGVGAYDDPRRDIKTLFFYRAFYLQKAQQKSKKRRCDASTLFLFDLFSVYLRSVCFFHFGGIAASRRRRLYSDFGFTN